MGPVHRMRAPVPAEAPIKSTIWLYTPDMFAKHVRREFGEPPASLCQHPPGPASGRMSWGAADG